MAHHEDGRPRPSSRRSLPTADTVPSSATRRAWRSARIAYEKKKYDEAWQAYPSMRSPFRLEDIVIVEKAWDLVARDDEQRALGYIVGTGRARLPAYLRARRHLIRGLALRRLCQYRAAHVAVREFRSVYGPTLAG